MSSHWKAPTHDISIERHYCSKCSAKTEIIIDWTGKTIEWEGQYQNCSPHKVADSDTISRPKGKWIKHIDDIWPAESTLECNICHHEQPLSIDNNFCPFCGTDMRKSGGSAV